MQFLPFEAGMRLDSAGDPRLAIVAFREGAALGDPQCHFVMGSFYQEGRGVSRNDAVALEHYTTASEKGLAIASFAAAQISFKSEDASVDRSKACFFLELAALQGHLDAMSELAQRLYAGDEVNKNIQLALAWLLIRSNLGGSEGKQTGLELSQKLDEESKILIRAEFKNIASINPALNLPSI